MKKFLSLITIVVFIFSMTACHNRGIIDENTYKNTIYIGNYNGAFGNKWLYSFIDEYKAIHPDINIEVENKKEEFTGGKLIVDMPYSRNDIYFLDHVNYADLYAAGVLEDITDTISEKIYNDSGDFPVEDEIVEKSIIDMVIPEYQDFLNLGTEDAPKYCALPYTYAISGIIYDVDLFNEQNLYFDSDGNIGVKKTSSDVGPGPDGDYSTIYDNGEPETWNDFLTLMDAMISKTLTPFTWSGQYIYQRQYFSLAVQSSYEGQNNMNLNFTLDGNDSVLGEITPDTGYKLVNQNGKLASIIASMDILKSSKNYSSRAFNQLIQSHTAAQAEFLYSVESSDAQRIAMLLESSYWETEATSVFDEMTGFDQNYGFGKRNFSIMSMPRFEGVQGLDDQINTRTTLYGDSSTKLVVLNKASTKKEIAKDFLQFIHTRSANAEFTVLSNGMRPFEYSLTDVEYNKLTPFMKTVMDRVTSPMVDVVIGETFYEGVLNNPLYFSDWLHKTKIENKSYSELMNAIRANSGASVVDIRAGMGELINQSNWPIK